MPGAIADARAAIDELAQFAGIAVVRSQHDQQHLAREPVLCSASRRQGAAGGRCRPAGRRRRAVVPERRAADDKTFWAHIDVDTLKPGSPMWTFPGNLRMQGDSGRILDQVLTELKAQGDAAVQGGGGGADRRAQSRARRAHRARRASSRPTRASPARSIRII